MKKLVVKSLEKAVKKVVFKIRSLPPDVSVKIVSFMIAARGSEASAAAAGAAAAAATEPLAISTL